jgi:Flp pilus assembly pilin Flp
MERAMKKLMTRLMREDKGQDVIEYALLAAGISIVVIPLAPEIGTALTEAYTEIRNDVQGIV